MQDTPELPTVPRPGWRLAGDTTPGTTELLAAVCAAGGAALHFVAAGTHAGSSVDVAVFSITGWAQLLFAALLVLRPSRRVLSAAAYLSVAIIAGWVASRTNGLPWGAHQGTAEDVGRPDLLATTLEAAVVLLAIVPAKAAASGRWMSLTGVAALLAVGGLATVASASGSTAHDHADSAAHAAHADDTAHTQHADDTAHTDHADHTDGADHASDADGAGHAGHVTQECTAPVTDEQRAAADQLVADTRAAVATYEDLDVAVADGYVPITPEGAQVVHYANFATLGDSVTLQSDGIESLVYAFDRNRTPYLLGAMYLLDDPAVEAPMPGGCLTTWHAHDNLCTAPGKGMVATIAADGSCPDGSSNTVTPMMLHVWSLDLPTGPFSELNEVRPQDIVAALAARG
jgi:hypothetical protein